ncbi:MAG TPA: hypothetical protein VGK58_12970 [Lacipirellulaceae bacterium]
MKRYDECRQQKGDRWDPLKCHQAGQQEAHRGDEKQQMPQSETKVGRVANEILTIWARGSNFIFHEIGVPRAGWQIFSHGAHYRPGLQ